MTKAIQNAKIGFMITPENWNYTYYQKDSIRSMVSLVAEHDNITYSVINFNIDTYIDTYEKDGFDLEKACEFLNQEFHDWGFVNPLAPKPNSKGCTSCSAHD